ncbi:MAG TPA: hypothetical protein VGK63_06170 [Candidatus Limnocylindrales bacterium]
MTAQADSAPRAARRNLRLASPILLGATTAVGAVMLSVAVLPADSLMRERRDLLFGLSAIAGLVGGFVGPRVVAGSLIGALARGGAAGYGWFVSTAAFVLMAAYVDSMERGVFATGLTAPLAWTLYFLAIAAFVGALVTIPVGIGWALAVWLIARVAPRQGRSATTPRGAKAVGTTAISVVVLGMVSGTVQARLTAPPSAQCLNLGGETAVAGAWSPDGSEFAVASTHDPNQEGHVRLFAWPAQTLLAEWTGWVDQTVAVDAAAHVYWSAWALDNSGPPGGSSGVLIAEPGADPVWLSTDQAHEAALWDLVWSAGELKGRTANLHHGAAIAVSGSDSGRVRKLPTVDDPSARSGHRRMDDGPCRLRTAIPITSASSMTAASNRSRIQEVHVPSR